MLNMREEKGKAIAQARAITEVKGGWLVPSQTSNKNYFVTENMDSCNCPDCKNRSVKCKHAFAVQFFLQKVTTKGKKVIVETKRMTYPQAWSAYNKSQETEKARFLELLNDIIETPAEVMERGRGQPKTSQHDLLFSSALKVYTQFSLRRFMSDLTEAKEKGFVEKKPCFASVGHFMQEETLIPQLKMLIQKSALPLKGVESKFALDSTGFRTSIFSDYCQEKHGKTKEHEWLKLHAVIGTKTNIICACNVTESEGKGTGDTTHLQPLATETANSGFEIQEFSADMAYMSRDNFQTIEQLGGIPYIPFREGTTGKPKGHSHIWRKMFNYFQFNKEEFLTHYHQRSNSESTFGALKMKFNDHLKSKTRTAQINELLLKVLCFNIVQVIHETNELGITANFRSV